MSRRPDGGLRVSAGFCLLVSWFALVNGWQMLLTVLAAAAAHEAGHFLVLRACGVRVVGLRVGIFGAEMAAVRTGLSYGRELAAVLAGPVVNLVWGGALALTGGNPVAAGAHLLLGAFNLLPLRPLDGGQALLLLVSWAAGPEAGEWCVRWVGACAAAGLAAGLIYLMWRSGGSLWLLPAVCGLLGAAGEELWGRKAEK